MDPTGQQVTETTAVEVAPLSQTSTEQVAETTPAESQSPKFVTQEELERFGAELLRREKQSSKDRMKAVDEKLNAIKTRLETGGGQLSQQQVNALRAQVEEDLDGGLEKAPASAITPEMQAQIDYADQVMHESFADAGMTVTANDPEWDDIQKVLDDPKGSYGKLARVSEKAAMRKAERVKTQATSAAARVPSGGAGTTTTTKKLTPAEKISKGLKGSWNTVPGGRP